MQRLLRIVALIAVLAVIGCGITAFIYKQRFDGPGPLAADTTLVIPRGAGLESIARDLFDAGVIDDGFLFRVGTRVLGAARNMKAGEYAFPAAVSMRGVVDILISGKTVLHRLTIPEGQTSSEIIRTQADYDTARVRRARAEELLQSNGHEVVLEIIDNGR